MSLYGWENLLLSHTLPSLMALGIGDRLWRYVISGALARIRHYFLCLKDMACHANTDENLGRRSNNLSVCPTCLLEQLTEIT